MLRSVGLFGALITFISGCKLPDEPVLLTDASLGADDPRMESPSPAIDDRLPDNTWSDGDETDGASMEDASDEEDAGEQGEQVMVDAGADATYETAADAGPDQPFDGAPPDDAKRCDETSIRPMIAAGEYHTCALLNTGGVRCWGEDANGQLGDAMMNLRPQPADQDLPLGVAVQAVAAGGGETCVLTSAGGVRCWGDNFWGSLGFDSNQVDLSSPPTMDVVTGAQAIAVGLYHACVLTVAGGVRCWGYNGDGELGDGTTIVSRSIPPITDVSLGIRVKAISAGIYHTCALTIEGGVRCWGYNYYGQLGDGSLDDRFSPPTTDVAIDSPVKAIAAGGLHTCALTEAGGVRCWGANQDGQLGMTTPVQSSAPTTDVPIDAPIKAIAAGGASTCAVTVTGGVRCWGYNGNGELGGGTVGPSRSAPGQDIAIDGPVQSIAMGDSHACALTSDGRIQCWGANGSGQLGDGTSASVRPSPAPVKGLDTLCRSGE